MSAVTFTSRVKLTELVPSVAMNSVSSFVVSEPSWLYLHEQISKYYGNEEKNNSFIASVLTLVIQIVSSLS